MSRFNFWKLPLQAVLAGTLLFPSTAAFAETITVQPGDSLYLIGQRHHVTVEQLKISNHLTSDMIYSGSQLFVPPQSRTYTVQSGDVLWKIAAAYGVSTRAIIEASNLTSPDWLEVGQKLLIPIETATAPPAAEEPDKPWVELQNYTVKQGDTPWTISLAHGIPMDEFLQANKMDESQYLSIGQVVKIPVHHIPVTQTPGSTYGEYLDWFQAAQYLFPINAVATVTDFETKRQFKVKRTIGAGHADTEPLTASDTEVIKQIWGGNFSWVARPVIVEINGRQLAASMTSMPHSVQHITDNNFPGHFDIHFLNSLRHKDWQVDERHQAAVRTAAGR
ncbi:LysM peptidoglycan-binding domain-containing protein [Brevibacillus humidisoli]|uniref:LysM peptidoglycan-binding domain-containing protein n=1 Tax=Brevibacillus humidisoli TaxID=2895522 RepID=UPI001E33CB1C|nr:LysM peptidoglycan-binding domain-containing protein [Brevibacillus humidisoli]UFJ41608.1 LysM peptidoglycan-binding domain-containing protein [Brevibacillus humidisoli]